MVEVRFLKISWWLVLSPSAFALSTLRRRSPLSNSSLILRLRFHFYLLNHSRRQPFLVSSLGFLSVSSSSFFYPAPRVIPFLLYHPRKLFPDKKEHRTEFLFLRIVFIRNVDSFCFPRKNVKLRNLTFSDSN